MRFNFLLVIAILLGMVDSAEKRFLRTPTQADSNAEDRAGGLVKPSGPLKIIAPVTFPLEKKFYKSVDDKIADYITAGETPSSMVDVLKIKTGMNLLEHPNFDLLLRFEQVYKKQLELKQKKEHVSKFSKGVL